MLSSWRPSGRLPLRTTATTTDEPQGIPHRRLGGWASEDLAVTLSLLPESVIEERPSWTLAVNRNQHLLGKTMLVLRRYCTAVIDIAPDEWALLRGELRRVVPALDGLFRPDQFNFAFLMNLDAHVHLHVVPRYRSSRRWHDRTFTDAVGRAVRPGATAAALGRAPAACRRDPSAVGVTHMPRNAGSRHGS